MIESQEKHSPADMGRMHQDARSLRAAQCVPALVAVLESSPDNRVREAARVLAAWNFEVEADSAAAAIFNVFYSQWCKVVAQERFNAKSAELMTAGVQACAGRLLAADPAGWFAQGVRQSRIAEALVATLDLLTRRLGPHMAQWRWGELHRMPLRHVLSSRGDLGQLLDHGGAPVRGDMGTVCNTGSGGDWTALSGAGYRLIADFAVPSPKLLAVDGQSQSGHPGSPHYSDQFDDWNSGRYHEIPLLREAASAAAVTTLRLLPKSSSSGHG
jgi:penicillin amidase